MALVDRAPPSRFAVIERGGRLVVIDNETGDTPLTAAERMEEHDRARGIEPIRPPKLSQVPDISEKARAASGLSARPAPLVQTALPRRPTKTKTLAMDPVRAKVATTITEKSRRAWADEQEDRPRPAANSAPARTASRQDWADDQADRPRPGAQSAPARIADRPAPQAGGNRQTIVTGKWWDAKGPRSITLGPKGQAQIRSGFVLPFLVLVAAATVILFIEPLLLLFGAFVLLRFGNRILAPMGASIIDKAVAERE